MKNTLLFTYSTNILVRLLTVNLKNCLTPKNQEICDPILVTLFGKCYPIIVTPVVNMRPHPAAHSHFTAVKRVKFAKVKRNTSKLRFATFTIESLR